MAKYDPLRQHLEGLRADEVTLSFGDIERMVGGLPTSAYEHRAWWANTRSHPNAVAWLDAGWELSHVAFRTRRIRLRRVRPPRTQQQTTTVHPPPPRNPVQTAKASPARTELPRGNLELARTLIVIPCSGAKRAGDAVRTPTSVLDRLPHDLAGELADHRRRNERAAAVDESTLLPASERYDGSLYAAGRAAISHLVDQGARVLILSGGYGLVLAQESIGMYEQVFRPAMWPTQLIERCLAGFAERHGVRTVVGVLSASTGYTTVFRKTLWFRGVDQVLLASPESTTGAMVTAPRAEGEWLAALAAAGDLPASWSSSDGLRMEVYAI